MRMGCRAERTVSSTRRSPTGSEWCAFRTGGLTCATWGPTLRRLRWLGRAAARHRRAACRHQRHRTQTVVALRSAQLITFTAMDIDDPRALVPVLCVGLAQRPPARFDEFSMPTRVGARADERLRSGTSLAEVVDYLGIPESARPVVESVFAGPRSYVEIVAGCHRDGQHASTEVGMSIVDTAAGRVLVSPSRAFDGEWVSTFSPGTPFAIAVAIEAADRRLAGRPMVPRPAAVPRFFRPIPIDKKLEREHDVTDRPQDLRGPGDVRRRHADRPRCHPRGQQVDGDGPADGIAAA